MAKRGTWAAALCLAAAGLCLAALVTGGAGLARNARADDEPETEAAKRFQPYAKETAAKYELKTTGDAPRKPGAARRVAAAMDESADREQGPRGAVSVDRPRPARRRPFHVRVHRCKRRGSRASRMGLAVTRPHSGGRPAGVVAGEGRNRAGARSGSAAPADTPQRRLRQMRDLGAGFTADKTSRQNVTRTLRLLSQPTFRYESQDPEVVDGALFALVEATDPEIFLCLEARLLEGKPTWHYGLVRMNSLPMAVSYKGKQVWVAESLAAATRTTAKTYPTPRCGSNSSVLVPTQLGRT